MPINISTRSNNLHVHAAGEYTLDEAKQTFREVLDEVERTGLTRVLFDGRDVTGSPSLIERFYCGEFAANAVADLRRRGWKGAEPQFAFVLEEPVLDPLRFGELVAQNRGANIKAFDNAHDAVKWLSLSEDDENTPDPTDEEPRT